MTTAQDSIGQLVDLDDVQRDAIHIALAPVEAAETLRPGDRIGFVQDGNTRLVGKTDVRRIVGIVDPFLRHEVWKGNTFWMFLIPNTITGLRHQWTHPAFDGDPGVEEARAWVADFAAKLDLTYNRLMEAGKHWVEYGDWTNMGANESYNGVDDANWPIFWRHFEYLTNLRVKDYTDVPFSCSC